jgi:hypothetical protein
VNPGAVTLIVCWPRVSLPLHGFFPSTSSTKMSALNGCAFTVTANGPGGPTFSADADGAADVSADAEAAGGGLAGGGALVTRGGSGAEGFVSAALFCCLPYMTYAPPAAAIASNPTAMSATGTPLFFATFFSCAFSCATAAATAGREIAV